MCIRDRNSFAKVYGRIETAAMLMHIACCPDDRYFTHLKKSTVSSSIMKAATKAFFEMSVSEEVCSERLSPIGFNILALPKESMRSVRVTGLYRYISRIVRPIWAKHIVKTVEVKSSEEVVQAPLCNFQERKLIQQKLSAVKTFIEQNFESFFVYSKSQVNSSRRGDVFGNDKHDLAAILKLLKRILEGLELFSIMDDAPCTPVSYTHLTLPTICSV
eukprot:TRINITY_DN26003_c0_g1_i2.p1 TRINITY_DN26003_c0_g1~~TRINITY_DN26003_c0_g1_i2.p1  ORF type:complete len:217 (-),score=50.17 TRINITY_DN26003_c0_g1_i2:34-684(-)